jgi:FlaA1/EpsC-like NDP-sugar epimerase
MPRIQPFSPAILIFAILLATDVVALLNINENLNHPYLEVDAGSNVQLTILQQGSKSLKACEAATSSYANALTIGCPTCRITDSKCTNTLTEDQQLLLSEEPINSYSAAIPNGVIRFRATAPSLAEAVCKESARSNHASKPNVVCYEPGKTRPPISARNESLNSTLQIIPMLWLAISGLVILAWIFTRKSIKTSALIAELVALPRKQKQVLIASFDGISVGFSLWLAFVLRLDTPYIPTSTTIWLILGAPLLALAIFSMHGLYHSIIRYLGLQAMMQIAKAMAVYLILLALAIYAIKPDGVPKSVVPIHGALALIFIGAMRGLARLWLTNARGLNRNGMQKTQVGIYGAGSAGIQLAHALSHSKELRPVVFLDDDTRLHKSRLGELQVYSPEELPTLISRYSISEILLAIPSATRQRRSEIINLLEALPIQVRTLPALSDLAEGKIKTDDLREVDIDDLLGRDAVMPDARLLSAKLTGKSVMVTGAGGSIGSELCRQIIELQPRTLVLFEQSEYALYQIEQELRIRTSGKPNKASATAIFPMMGSVTDQARLERIIDSFKIETIYHAAAYKHVPMVEHNPCEGVINNILGTFRTAMAALNKKVETFVLISTDKAVRPTNTMGATKRFAEMIVQAIAANELTEARHTSFSAVRFGNVLGSSGSVVPLFREQIRRGGPITVTDPRIIRYFMTISEAAQLVLHAGAMGKDGDVFVLDMGEPVRILDLAQRMVRLSGLQVKSDENSAGDIEIVFTGLRPGEKLYEELLTGNNPEKTAHSRIMRASESSLTLKQILPLLERAEKCALSGDSDGIRRLLLEAVRDFQPQCGNEDFIEKTA